VTAGNGVDREECDLVTTLWDTTGTAVVKALAAERRTGGAVTSGNALTLVVVVDERDVHEAEEAATLAASKHPMRMLMVIRRHIDAPVPRLDAEVLMGGRLGPGEAVVMRMHGRLALHAESVTLPLLAPDAPVVAWWHGAPPDRISYDPLGVFANRRITDVSRADDRVAALRQRAVDFAPGDTDLAWTRITGWRAALGVCLRRLARGCRVGSGRWRRRRPFRAASCRLALLALRLLHPSEQDGRRPDRPSAHHAYRRCRHQRQRGLRAAHPASRGAAGFGRSVPERSLGELLAEELRRLDADRVFAEALGAVSGLTGLNDRPGQRVHIWKDPALADSSTAAS
jgi:glucose-6-phosphate dehydrogenase assembly protein OpcA